MPGRPGDDLVALDPLLFLVCCGLSYWAQRDRKRRRRCRVERVADAAFPSALVFMAVNCVLLAYELLY